MKAYGVASMADDKTDDEYLKAKDIFDKTLRLRTEWRYKDGSDKSRRYLNGVAYMVNPLTFELEKVFDGKYNDLASRDH